MIIGYYNELPSTDEKSTRIYELERAMVHMKSALEEAQSRLQGVLVQEMRPVIAAVYVNQALRLIDCVL